MTSAQLASSQAGIDSTLVLPLSTAIKLVIDYSAANPDLELPEGVSDTFALVSDIQKVSEYVSNAQNMAAESYAEALNATLTDNNVIAGNSSSEIPIADTYYQILPLGYAGGDRILVNEDGTGYLSDTLTGSDFTWATTDTGIEMTFGENGFSLNTFFQFLLIDGATVQVETEVIQTGTSVQWITQSETNDLLLYTTHTLFHYPNGELVDSEITDNPIVSNFVKEKGIVRAENILDVSGNNRYSLNTDTVIEEILEPISGAIASYHRSARDVQFTGDLTNGGDISIIIPELQGNGSITQLEVSLPWIIGDNGHLIIQGDEVDGSDDTDIVFLKANDGKTPAMNILNNEKDELDNPFTKAQSGFTLLEEAEWVAEGASGIYKLSFLFDEPLSHFWIELNADGTALQAWSDDLNLDGELTDNEISQNFARWQLNENGNVVVRRLWSSSTFAICDSGSFELAGDCDLLFHEREWDLHQITDDGSYYMRQMHRYFQDYNFVGLGNHVLSFASTDNRSFIKVDERPVELPAMSKSQPLKMNGKGIKTFDFDVYIKKEMKRESKGRK